MKGFFSMYKGVWAIFARYWIAYGGLKSLIRSPYLHLAFLLTVVTYGKWSQPLWWETVIDVTPDILGFTLGGFAIFIGFGSEKFKTFLNCKDEEETVSLYVKLCAVFVHFIIVQLIALIYAFCADALWFPYEWPGSTKEIANAILPVGNLVAGFIGYGFFLYALTSMLAATMHMFRVATWYESFEVASSKLPDSGEQSSDTKK